MTYNNLERIELLALDGIKVRDEKRNFQGDGTVSLIYYQTGFTGTRINARKAREIWHFMLPKYRNFGSKTDQKENLF